MNQAVTSDNQNLQLPPEPGVPIRRTVYGNSPDILGDIYNDDVNMTVWKRQIPEPVKSDVSSLAHNTGYSSFRTLLRTSEIGRLEQASPFLTPLTALCEDIKLIADMFSYLFELSTIGLRLSRLDDAMCPKFHVDMVPCRLITTYMGPATEWLAHDAVKRNRLGRGSNGFNDIRSGIYSSPDDIQTLVAGDIALLKGELWEGNEGTGLAHRSPAVESDQQRLLLTIDFASAE